MKDYITVIGAGLAGSEAAYQIVKRGIKVKLYEMKPIKYSPAHSNENFAEIVCSNSFKSNLLTNACGLLKEELRKLDSLLVKIADETRVPAGQALAVDRESFAEKVTQELKQNKLIEIVHEEVTGGTSTEVTANYEDLKEEANVLTITNKTGSELPSTGGIGTTMFYVIGTVLVLGAAVLLISKRRMNVR